jgi:RNA-binding protein
MPLTGAAARELRALAHHLAPVVTVGKEGLTKKVVEAVADALGTHELLKIKVRVDSRMDRQILATHLSGQTASEIVQIVGGVVTLYRPRKDKPTIPIPKGYTPSAPASMARDEDE